MKGVVFTEFIDLVETKFGLEMVDKIISQSTLESEGAYTAIGTYKFSELVQLLQNLHNNTGIPIDELLLIYGQYFFNVIENICPDFLCTYKNPIEMLSCIENHINVEVLKIYPNAELPTFTVQKKTSKSLTMIYKSSNAMYHFGLGIMEKAFTYFNTTASIIIEKIKEDGTEVKFIINQN